MAEENKVNDYSFAVNKLKLQRAIGELAAEGKKNPTQEEVKARYVKLLGLLAEEEEAKTDAPRRVMKAAAFKEVKARKK